MSFDLILGLWLGAVLACLVFVKALAWAIAAAGRLLLRWIDNCT